MVVKLDIKPTQDANIFIGVKKDGVKYTIRKDRHRYFFPDEWLKFLEVLRPDKRIFYETLLQTGSRIEEALNIKPKDIEFERNRITLYVTKSKAKKHESKLLGGRTRSFEVSEQYLKRLKKYIIQKNIGNDEIIFPISKQAAWKTMREALQRAGIQDYYNFSLHNVRKTSGMWLKALIIYSREITEGEICMRLGHDFNTFLKHYGSPSIFNDRDRNMMIKILGGIYHLQ